MSQVMISYSRNDREFADHLNQQLRDLKISTWIDQQDIQPGQPWRQAIFDALVDSECVILCLSPSYLESEVCRMECFLARSYGKRLLPVRVQPCIRLLAGHQETKGLEDIHILDFHSKISLGLSVTEDDLIRSLVAAIRGEEKSTPDDVIYFAYPVEEAVYATQIANDLTKAGIPTWIGTRDLKPGVDWQHQQWDAMMKARALLMVLTEKAATSGFIRQQILFAQTRKLPMLPIVTPEIANEPTAMRDLSASLDTTYETRLLSEINWFFPQPDDDALVAALVTALKE